MKNQRVFSHGSLFKPDYLGDKRESHAIQRTLMKDINKGGGGGAIHAIEQSNERKCRSSDSYIPVNNQNRIFEFNQIEKRYKMTFKSNKIGYSNNYLSQLTDLITQKGCKDYVSQRKKLTEKYKALYSLDAKKNRNNKGTLYLTENQKTIQTEKRKTIQLKQKKFVFSSTSRKSRASRVSSIKTLNTFSQRIIPNEEFEQPEVELIVPRNEKKLNEFGNLSSQKEVEDNLKKQFNFYEVERIRTNTFSFKNRLNNAKNALNYHKNINPSKIEYFKRLILKQKKIPSISSVKLLPILQRLKGKSNISSTPHIFETS